MRFSKLTTPIFLIFRFYNPFVETSQTSQNCSRLCRLLWMQPRCFNLQVRDRTGQIVFHFAESVFSWLDQLIFCNLSSRVTDRSTLACVPFSCSQSITSTTENRRAQIGLFCSDSGVTVTFAWQKKYFYWHALRQRCYGLCELSVTVTTAVILLSLL